MLFNSWVFAGFLAIVLPLYYVLPLRGQNILLLAGSYVFYGAWDWRFLGLLLLSTGMDFAIGLAIDGSRTEQRRKALLALSVIVNLSILGFFKYWNFFIESASSLLASAGLSAHLPTLQIVLPVGISFYTFQTLGYTIDVYRRVTPASRHPLTYALYVAYFPQLVAGPIERITRLLPQLEKPRTVTPDMVYSGAQLMLWGFVKKVAIADSVGVQVDRIFSNPSGLHSVELWLGIYGFALQIYADFSGYTDIARGVSRLFGVELMLNFRQPYLSANITDFWRRWHISLSTWLRDYLYIPLGGNRLGPIRQYVNLILTMLIGGLWHGAAWTFVVWGGLHGAYLAVHRILRGGNAIPVAPHPRTAMQWLRFIAGVLVTFHLVCLAWVWFRAGDSASALAYTRGLFILGGSVDWAGLTNSGLVQTLVFYGILAFAIDVQCWRRDRDVPFAESTPVFWRALGYGVALFILAFVREGESDAFIYFQF